MFVSHRIKKGNKKSTYHIGVPEQLNSQIGITLTNKKINAEVYFRKVQLTQKIKQGLSKQQLLWNLIIWLNVKHREAVYTSISMWPSNREALHQSLCSDTNLASATLVLLFKWACTQGRYRLSKSNHNTTVWNRAGRRRKKKRIKQMWMGTLIYSYHISINFESMHSVTSA